MKASVTTTDESERFIELFDRVRQIEPAGRHRFLEEACAAEPQWREEIESLLAYDNDAPVLNATSALKAFARELAEDDLSGKEIGHYRIIEPIGAGGMGRVYLAEDRTLARRVALKFLPEFFTTEPGTVEPERIRRFAQEARAASALNHPNIITVYETGQHERRHYIAYELVEGQTLRTRLKGEPLRWQEAVVIGAQIAAALKAAHAAGIIHRDIKPENVMLRADGLVKVLDFGIAKRLEMQTAEAATEGEGATTVASVTLAGQVFGTLGYLAPEQARGEKLDARADIFALGMVLYEMLAGHPWAKLSSAEKLKAVQSADELPLVKLRRHDLPMALTELVGLATRKEREARHVTAEQIHTTLEELRLLREVRSAERNKQIARQLAQQRANQSLNQAVALYASDAKTRLSLTEWWTIQRRSNAPRGTLERTLLRKSLFSVLAKGCAVAGVASLLALLLAAWFSITERWVEQVMHDGHARRVRQLSLSPEGKRLVSGHVS